MGEKLLFRINPIANASPIASDRVVEDVGARLCGQASLSIEYEMQILENLASVEHPCLQLIQRGFCCP